VNHGDEWHELLLSALEAGAGPIGAITVEPLGTSGFSGSRHERIRVARNDGPEQTYVVKRTTPTLDWTCVVSGALRSRELALLQSMGLGDVWSIFHRPYLACAELDHGESCFLMQDLSASLFRDAREPLLQTDEDLLLRSLARLHARFWARPPDSAPWLASSSTYCSLLGADRPGDAGWERLLPESIRSGVLSGWREALRRVPPRVAERLRLPGAELQREWAALPHTIVHGDAKVANFAILADGQVTAFDWALMGWAPPSIDVGWYIAVNASRLAGTQDAALATYRRVLESELGRPISGDAWRALEDAAVLLGARMLLWSKANALASDRPGAKDEWSWWMERLSAIA
jgi:hypothetical protein